MYLRAGIELLTEENRERNVRWREMTGVEGGGAVFAIGCSAISVQKKLRKVLFGDVAAIVTVAVVLFVWNGVVKPVFDNARIESTISVESQL